MRNLTTILLLSIGLMAAKCQEPDIECYSQGYVDSLLLIHSENHSNELINCQEKIDSLILELQRVQPYILSDSVSIFVNDIYFELMDSEIVLEIQKSGQYFDIKTRRR